MSYAKEALDFHSDESVKPANDFIRKMGRIQSQRSARTGHGWKEFAERFGPAALFSEMASIMHRLELMIWRQGRIAWYEDFDFDRAEDLLVDLGNYTSFLHDFLEEKRAEHA